MGGDDFPERKKRLMEVFDVQEDWNTKRLSDGQRKRVQLCMNLIKPAKLMLLDEVSVDLDLLARISLLEYLKAECETRGVTIIYATHIFVSAFASQLSFISHLQQIFICAILLQDSILQWATHLLHLSNGRVAKYGKLEDFEELKEENWRPGVSPILSLLEKWLREEEKEKKELLKQGFFEKKESLVEKLAEKSDKYYNYWG